MHKSANALRYMPRPGHSARIQALAHRYKRYGVGMIYLKLRQEGGLLNYKRVEQLYQEAKLQVRRRKRKKSGERHLHARTEIEHWRQEYNEERPKKMLGGPTPAACAKQLQ
jgi:transposase InsO family protein